MVLIVLCTYTVLAWSHFQIALPARKRNLDDLDEKSAIPRGNSSILHYSGRFPEGVLHDPCSISAPSRLSTETQNKGFQVAGCLDWPPMTPADWGRQPLHNDVKGFLC